MIRTIVNNTEVRVVFRHRQYGQEFDRTEPGQDPRVALPIPGTDGLEATGETRCLIYAGPRDTPTLIADSIAHCSKHDNFCRETGRQIALARALKDFGKPERGAILAAYFNRRKQPATKTVEGVTWTA